MNIKTFGRGILALFLLLLLAGLPGINPEKQIVLASDGEGSITIYNSSSKEIWVYIRDKSVGKIWPKYNDTFPARLGEFKVTIEWDNGMTSAWFHLTKSHPYDSWTITDRDIN